MKKLLKTALISFFVLTICFPEVVTASSNKAAMVITSDPIGPFTGISRKRTREPEELQSLIRKTQFICLCPTLDEFYAAFKSFAASPEFEQQEVPVDSLAEMLYDREHWETFVEKQLSEFPISPSYEDRREKSSYTSEEVGKWLEKLAKFGSSHIPTLEVKTKYSRQELETISDFVIKSLLEEKEHPFRTICFFKNENNGILCLAWCGKGNDLATSFCTKIKTVFGDLKHILICGICGCPNTEVEIGDILLSDTYVYLKGTSGNPGSSRKSLTEAIIYGEKSHYKIDKIALFEQLKYLVDFINLDDYPAIHTAQSFSFSAFIEEKTLSESLRQNSASLSLMTIIDMESVSIVKAFSDIGCDVLQARFKSDEAGDSNPELFQKGKKNALESIQRNISSFTHTWMEYLGIVPKTPSASDSETDLGTPPSTQVSVTITVTGSPVLMSKYHIYKSLSTSNLPEVQL